jgi:hypothetical protein
MEERHHPDDLNEVVVPEGACDRPGVFDGCSSAFGSAKIESDDDERPRPMRLMPLT